MKSKEIIDKINELTGLELNLSNDGSANFVYDERNVLLHFEEELGICIIYVELTTLSPAAVSAVIPRLLEANFLFLQTNGGALSFQKDTRMVSLNFMVPCSEQTDSDGFIDILNRDLSTADEWTQKVKSMNDEIMSYRKKGTNQTNGISTGDTASQQQFSAYNFMNV
ncbi:type III secretion system chaperone [Succinivibrio dextrinosolvens]|uniref:type III secretion system chaperone n=1 Tax=Succinivibrio dextrinosolvens TaxID=83771 RepID=UPI00241C2BC3|nr:type III secretion system chaperone [Succinivibrio dextrinosolvens]MBE6422489.1 type III secretion system chaperone [Succinivibrio dextrinosolvens]